ncbi:helix-turn-helix domain-containing protein [Actinacidiphila sp. bgisy160]|uniref:helix-turn-helix domain-containing protein n=1 Tax=Actinacidiphila sp. bgisy160 TaxID=3413796 RepID=UPI003D751FEB
MATPATTRAVRTAGIAGATGREHGEVLRAAALQVRGQVAPVAAHIVERIRDRHPAYREPALAPSGFLAETEGSVAAVLDSLADPGRSAVSAEYLSWVGERRAWQGFPLEPMMGACRTAGDVLWLALVRAWEAQRPGGTQLIARAAAEVWDLFERDSRLMADAYLRARGEVTFHQQRGRRALEGLLAGRVDTPGLAEAADALGLPEYGRFAVAVVRGATGSPLPVRRRTGVPAGVRVHRAFPVGCEVLLADLGDLALGDFAAALEVPAGTRAGLSPEVDRLGAVGHARERAELALRTCTRDGEVAVLDRRYPAGLLTRRPDVATEVAAGVLGALRDVEAAEAAVLLETLEAWLDASGSAEKASAALFCHPNTVRRRLRRLEEVTGRSTSRPRDVVHLALALDAERVTAAHIPGTPR